MTFVQATYALSKTDYILPVFEQYSEGTSTEVMVSMIEVLGLDVDEVDNDEAIRLASVFMTILQGYIKTTFRKIS